MHVNIFIFAVKVFAMLFLILVGDPKTPSPFLSIIPQFPEKVWNPVSSSRFDTSWLPSFNGRQVPLKFIAVGYIGVTGSSDLPL